MTEPQPFPVLKIRAKDLHPQHITELKLDDLDLIAKACVVSLRLEMGSDILHRVHLELEVIPDVELPVELSAALAQHESKPAQQEPADTNNLRSLLEWAAINGGDEHKKWAAEQLAAGNY